jgi:hypothetical protein
VKRVRRNTKDTVQMTAGSLVRDVHRRNFPVLSFVEF